MLSAIIFARIVDECCDRDQDKISSGEKPVDLLLMEREEIEEVDGIVSSDGLSVSSDRSSSSHVTEN